MARGTRTRIEDGIYRDRAGLSAIVTVQGQTKEKRFDGDTDLQLLRVWRADTTSVLLKRARLTSDHGTFARDFAKFLRSRKGRTSYASDRSHAKPWIVAFGHRKRHGLTRQDITVLIAKWDTAGAAPRTLRHRVRVCREMFEYFDPEGAHPLKKLKLPRPARTAPIPVDHELIANVAQSLASGLLRQQGCGPNKTQTTIRRAAPVQTFGRYLVYATCGQRPAQIGRAEPEDVSLDRRLWFIRPAKGGDPVVLPLNDDMVFAWEVFIAAKAWGTFNVSSFTHTLHRHGWPTHIRPYRMRHTFAIDLLMKKVPLETLQGLLGHLNIQTTRIYAPVLLALSQEAIGLRTLNLREILAVPRGVPRDDDTERNTLNKRDTKWTVARTNKKAASS